MLGSSEWLSLRLANLDIPKSVRIAVSELPACCISLAYFAHDHDTISGMEDAPADMRPNNIAEPVIDSFDFAENFATDKTFSTRDDLLKWVRGEAVKYNKSIKGEMQHLMNLWVEGDDVPNEGHPDISITEELEAIQVRFNNADYNTKIQIKEQLRQIAFPETTPPRPPTEKENESLPFGM
ncbi:hypothetical protein QL285_048877 [Trifolium repens]|nr:hypothetical protein QL285_048877 [Trifolium repens]